MQGSIQLSAIAVSGRVGNHQNMILSGQDGTLEIRYATLGGGELRGCRAGDKDFQTLAVPAELWGANDPNAPFDVFKITTAAQPFIDAILAGRSADPTFYDGYKVQQVISAAIESDRQGRWVTIE